MIVYDYPLSDILWSTLIFSGFMLVLFVMVWCFIDNCTPTDHHGWAKLG